MSITQKQTATQSQKLMIFVLSMSLYGLATLFTELIPSFQVGIGEGPQNRAMVGVAAITGTAAQLLMGTVVDILKVQLAVEDFEAVAGLPESVFATEGFAFLNDLLFSGILFCLLPTLYLVPKLYGKIEPLLGMAPRTPHQPQGPDRVRRGLCGRHRGGTGRHRRHVPRRLGGRVGRERHRPGFGDGRGRGDRHRCPADHQAECREEGRGEVRCTRLRLTA